MTYKQSPPPEPLEPAERTKAFRSRLAESSFRRVEGYIASDEKERVDRVRQELQVTSDVAVAGLVRLGLSAYESAMRQGPGASLQTTSSDWLAASGGVQGACAHSAQANFPTTPSAASPELVHTPANPIAQFFKSRKETHRAQ
ncbi:MULTISPECIES: hypothetical protein [unclassified Variovorax]|uniref:hypothetical protein n=1 Tax=unclassified Variovorax TaxID=663243 RepID=UPI0013170133|nr:MULTISPECIES: hypothetical protein [unclassified Variovorax]VTU42294.1 hypothetical protein H6P1_00150 [Variovorax sp. PBL-H6]VTU44086.1 hypothetical protein SRS16P1_00752 [Variovorax sp. SRS16]VTU44168.1 hypothetical protein E5P1_00745 [Variovorax sp. PBL-E5]